MITQNFFDEIVTNNIILKADSYKHSHFLQYPEGTHTMYSYIESRGGRYDKVLFFGLQAFIKRYLLTPITRVQVDYAERLVKAHGEPFNREGWDYILNRHAGLLPVTIKAVPEGTVVDTKNVLVTIENDDPNLPWLTSFVETALLRAVWYPVTVGTGSWHVKQVIKSYLERTSDDVAGNLPFRLHDFGARAATSSESAAIGGLAHLVNFMGTDTIEALPYAEFFYGEPMAGFSIPASEHSTITSWGKEGEVDAYRNMLSQFAKPGSIVACVSDSYDVYNATEKLWGEELRQQIIDSGAILVVRPDSGDPLKVPVELIEILDKKFGHTVNSKGYRVLNNVRVIQGDGVNPQTIEMILGKLLIRGYSAENIAFGMGGKLLQAEIDRDTQKFAMKASAAEVNGEWRDVYKDPITDAGKKSKRGRLALVRTAEGFDTVPEGAEGDLLEVVYSHGLLRRNQKLADIRARADASLVGWAPTAVAAE